jgi:hypothetical protein
MWSLSNYEYMCIASTQKTHQKSLSSDFFNAGNQPTFMIIAMPWRLVE